MDELKAKMERSSAALAQFERDLSVINPDEKTSILSARLLQLNTEFTTAQGDRMRKQAAFESVQNASLEAAEASTQGEQLRKLAEHLDDALGKFAGVKTQYGVNHPQYKRAQSEVTELERQFVSAAGQYRGAGEHRIPGGGESRRHAEESHGRDQRGIRPSECPFLRI